jgi:hypothetical protein
MERISKGRRDLRKEMQREEDVNNLWFREFPNPEEFGNTIHHESHIEWSQTEPEAPRREDSWTNLFCAIADIANE